MLLKGVISAFCAYFLAEYGAFPHLIPAWLILSALFFVCLTKTSNSPFTKKEIIFLGGYALLFGAGMILSSHIHLEDPYNGLKEQNYITPFIRKDLFAFPFLALGMFIFAKFLCSCRFFGSRKADINTKIIGKPFWIITAVIAVCYLPYLLVYYPGMVFGDSLISILQVLRIDPLIEQQPVAYALFLRFCFWLGGVFRSHDCDPGIAISCVIQILFLSGCFSFLICWIVRRGSLRKHWYWILTAVFACVPYFAIYGITLWKDPIFSASLMMVTLFLADTVMGVPLTKMRGAAFGFFALFVLFFRGNGKAVFAALTLALLIAAILSRRKDYRTLFFLSLGFLFSALLVTGPIYTRLGIETRKEESMGIFLNQIARVGASNGRMNAEDEEFLNELLGMEWYPKVYHPCCVDWLKWDRHINRELLNDSLNFYEHWFSLFRKNPGIYFKAWELNTVGFWSLIPLEESSNTQKGVPRNIQENAADGETIGDYRITYQNLTGNDSLRKVFRTDAWSFPLGILHWALLLLGILLLLKNRWGSLLILVPSFALAFTLIAASPWFYWPRYGAAEHFLFPLYVFLFFLSTDHDLKRTFTEKLC